MKIGSLVKDKWGHLGIIVHKVHEAGHSPHDRWMIYWCNICEFWDYYDWNLEVVLPCPPTPEVLDEGR